MQLSREQQIAASHKDGPALVLAVPGSGKTTVLLHRIDRLKEQGVDPKNILTVTFSKTQALDMAARYGKNAEGTAFYTIHSFCYQLVRGYLRMKNRNLRVIESFDGFHKYDLIRRLYQQHTGRRMPKEEVDEFFRVYGFVKNTLQEDRSSYPELHQKLIVVYEEAKMENHMIDFDDMLTLARQILLDEPEWLARTRKRFPYVQLDEGQDTSKVQMDLLRLIAEPSNHLFILADDDQSIYGFRGADATSLLSFRDWYPDAKLYFLEDNYRSAPSIIKSATLVIRNNQTRYQKEIRSTKDPNGPVVHKVVPHLKRQTRFLLRELAKIPHDKKVAVLYRNNLSGIAIAQALQSERIPFSARQKWDDFVTHPIVQDLFAMLRLAENPRDTESFLFVYYKLGEYISKDQAQETAQTAGPEGVWQALLALSDIPDWRYDQWEGLRNRWKKLSRMPFGKRIEYIENELKYGKYLEEWKRMQTSPDNTRQILDIVKAISQQTDTIEELARALRPSPSEEEERIVLSTIHGAKGLEYDIVYMVDLIQQEFPGNLKVSGPERLVLEEERRLFYVGMTRAKEKLTMISLANCNGKPCEPTQFIQEIFR